MITRRSLFAGLAGLVAAPVQSAVASPYASIAEALDNALLSPAAHYQRAVDEIAAVQMFPEEFMDYKRGHGTLEALLDRARRELERQASSKWVKVYPEVEFTNIEEMEL